MSPVMRAAARPGARGGGGGSGGSTGRGGSAAGGTSGAAKGQHVVGVDMSKLPVPADIGSDNVHPNDQGYAYIAYIWYAAIKNLLPK